MKIRLQSPFKKRDSGISPSVRDYQELVRKRIRRMPENRTLALANSIGALDMDQFVSQGNGHVAVLRAYGLADGMAIYDLGCGCGRTAQALKRSDWTGTYTGADVVPELLEELAAQCPGYGTVLNYDRTIEAADASLDMVFGWSVFTHLFPVETYLYIEDCFRALKPGGTLLFSFLEMEESEHDRVWENALRHVREGVRVEQLDAFLHRDWIVKFARLAGFEEPIFTDGTDSSKHAAFWQALAVLKKPEA